MPIFNIYLECGSNYLLVLFYTPVAIITPITSTTSTSSDQFGQWVVSFP